VDDVVVADEDVDEQVENLRARFRDPGPVERLSGTTTSCPSDISAEIDGEQIDSVTGISYQVGTGTMLEGMDDALRDLSAGGVHDVPGAPGRRRPAASSPRSR